MSTVIMRHPTLPPEQEIEVDEGAVPHHAGAGWQVVPAEELQARAAAAAEATAKALAAAAGNAQEPPAPVAAEASEDKPTPARPRAKATEKKDEE